MIVVANSFLILSRPFPSFAVSDKPGRRKHRFFRRPPERRIRSFKKPGPPNEQGEPAPSCRRPAHGRDRKAVVMRSIDPVK
jgi:hypothetical protein